MPEPTVTVIRRRGATGETVRISGSDHAVRLPRKFDDGGGDVGSAERIRAAAERIAAVSSERRTALHGVTLRSEQHDVFADVAIYFAAAAVHLAATPSVPFTYGRYVQPPRTGKTVVAAQIIAVAEVTAVVLVPSVALARQWTRELQEKLPTTKVGIYCGDEKDAVSGGVIVATYQIVQAHLREGKLPLAIHGAALVICDEAHRAMTESRMHMLMAAFDPAALRIACTATPDWSEQRTLATYFPWLIHEITLQEAVELDLFARLVVQVLGMQSDGSGIRLVGGDFDAMELGAVMTEDPFLDATLAIRYDPRENAAMPCLVCCVSREQARAVHDRLEVGRPKGTPAPGLILGDTPPGDRENLLGMFEKGEIDTIVTVRVLVEGWDSPRCKLLIDLAPTVSQVLSKQKFFRVMTKLGDLVARIFMLLPEGLSKAPIFPQELFGKSVETEGYDTWFAKRTAPKKDAVAKPTRGPKAKSRPAFEPTRAFDSADLRLNPNDREEIAEVILGTFKGMRKLPSLAQFCETHFASELFDGTGTSLLRYCGIRVRRASYLRFMGRIFSDLAANRLLEKDGFFSEGELPSCEEDAALVRSSVQNGQECEIAWRALFGPDETSVEEIDDAVDERLFMERIAFLRADGETLTKEMEEVLSQRFPLDERGDEELTLRKVGERTGIPYSRVLSLECGALSQLRESLRRSTGREEKNVLDEIDPERKSYRVTNRVFYYAGHSVWVMVTRNGRMRFSWNGHIWAMPKGQRTGVIVKLKTGELAIQSFVGGGRVATRVVATLDDAWSSS